MRSNLAILASITLCLSYYCPAKAQTVQSSSRAKDAENPIQQQSQSNFKLAQAPASTAKAIPPTAKSVQPQEVAPEEKLTIAGTNFSTKSSEDTIYIGDKKASIVSAASDKLVVNVPKDAQEGKQKVIVMVNNQKSNTLDVTITMPPPELTSVSLNSASPGASLSISGKNFARNPHDNKVTIGGAEAEVTSGSSSNLSVVIPNIESPQYSVPISVQVGKQRSKKSLNIDIQNREY